MEDEFYSEGFPYLALRTLDWKGQNCTLTSFTVFNATLVLPAAILCHSAFAAGNHVDHVICAPSCTLGNVVHGEGLGTSQL